jgi:CheY-like chemotaxis protein
LISKPDINKTILIADSSRDMINLLGKYFKAEGYMVLIAVNGKQALAIAMDKHPHIVLVDAGIPEMDGFEVCRVLKMDKSITNPSVIIMTGQGDASEIEKTFAVEADGFVSRPVKPEDLLVKVQSLLKPKKKRAAGQMVSSKNVGKKVLLVEDNELNQNYITAILEDLGFAIELADNGGTALEKFLTGKYDLIITDINVPVINGIELSRIIRTKYSKDIPIVAISGHTEKEFIDKCTVAGIDLFVTKPFTAKELKEVVFRIFPGVDQENGQEAGTSEFDDNGIRRYDYSQAIEMARDDEELLKKWLHRFKEIVKTASSSVDECVKNNEFPARSKVFHELINYSGYFGLEELRSYIMELNSILQVTSDKERIANFYRKIGGELENISSYYNTVE